MCVIVLILFITRIYSFLLSSYSINTIIVPTLIYCNLTTPLIANLFPITANLFNNKLMSFEHLHEHPCK